MKGFTLIELLVTISIIAILTAIGMVAYSSVIKQGRDSKRQADLRTVQSALEQYHNDNFYYPGSIGFGSQLNNSAGRWPSIPITKVYLNKTSNDPLPLPYPQYTYVPLGTGCSDGSPQKCTSYCLYATLENSSNFVSSCNDNSKGNYSVSSP